MDDGSGALGVLYSFVCCWRTITTAAAAAAAAAVQEPAGFQLRLLSLLHCCSIAGSTYLPQAKSVAVSDSSGSVSLIHLAAPAVLWWVTLFAHAFQKS